jgi:RNA polymerase sigma-70 factor (ECF subfamily)
MSSADDPAISEQELVRLAQQDPASPRGRWAAAQLLSRHRGQVYGWCRRYVRDHERALDLSQDVLMTAYRALGGFEGRAPFSAWLFMIARRQCIRAMRPRSLMRDEDAEVDALVDPADGPEQRFDDRREIEELLRLMRAVLEPREQDAVWLRYVENASVDDITRTLGLTAASGARGLLQTAKRKLRSAVAARSAAEGGR